MSEYWIDDGGSVTFADSEVGDLGHEGVVIDSLMRDVADRCERLAPVKNSWGRRFSDQEYIDWEEFTRALATAYGEQLKRQYPDRSDWIDKTLQADPYRLARMAFNRARIALDELSCIEGRMDARDFAMRNWGWKTYRDGYVDTWYFRPKDLQAIIRGIDEISEELGWSDRKLNRAVFTINVFSSGKHFDLSYQQMLNPKPKPSVTPQVGNLLAYAPGQATKQVRDIDVQQVHPVYKRPGVAPLGDWAILSFKTFVEGKR